MIFLQPYIFIYFSSLFVKLKMAVLINIISQLILKDRAAGINNENQNMTLRGKTH